jgi:hypothetical protein
MARRRDDDGRPAERFSAAESATAGDSVDRIVPSGQRTPGRLDAHALHVLRRPTPISAVNLRCS